MVLTVLFIYKLCKVYKSVDQNGEKLMNLITKTSLLFFWTAITFFIGRVMIVALVRNNNNIHFRFIVLFGIAIDIYANFLCIWLSYRYFGKYYDKLCGCCHLKCYKCCIACTGSKNMKRKMEEEIGSATSITTPDSTQLSTNGDIESTEIEMSGPGYKE